MRTHRRRTVACRFWEHRIGIPRERQAFRCILSASRATARTREAVTQQPCGELVHVRFSDRNGSRRHQTFGNFSGFRRDLSIFRTRRRGGNPGKIDIVFDGERGGACESYFFRDQVNPHRPFTLLVNSMVRIPDLVFEFHAASCRPSVCLSQKYSCTILTSLITKMDFRASHKSALLLSGAGATV